MVYRSLNHDLVIEDDRRVNKDELSMSSMEIVCMCKLSPLYDVDI